MKSERKVQFNKWWKSYKTSSKSDALLNKKLKKADKDAVQRTCMTDPNSGEWSNFIEIIRSCESAFKYAHDHNDREQLYRADTALTYLYTVCYMIDKGCPDEAVARACLEPDGTIAVAMLLNKFHADPSRRAPFISHLIRSLQGSVDAVAATHGSREERDKKRSELINEIKMIRKLEGLSYTKATDLMGVKYKKSGRAIRKYLEPDGSKITENRE